MCGDFGQEQDQALEQHFVVLRKNINKGKNIDILFILGLHSRFDKEWI
jgi:hypothetical protein